MLLHILARFCHDRADTLTLFGGEGKLVAEAFELLLREHFRCAAVRPLVRDSRTDKAPADRSGEKDADKNQSCYCRSIHIVLSPASGTGSDKAAASSAKLFISG